MKVEYDNTADALYIRFLDEKVSETKEIEPGIIIDYGEEGDIRGIEILQASKRLHRKAMEDLSGGIPTVVAE